MSNRLMRDATEIEALLPAIMRRFFAGNSEPGQPAAELPIAQLNVCSILQNGAQSMSALSEELEISLSALTQLADRLEKAGLVERVAGCDDRRTKTLSLTEYGRDMMRARRKMRVEHVALLIDRLSQEDRADVIVVLHRLLTAAGGSDHAVDPEELILAASQ
jgi:DNA-binding MarR family transcriptional regulator